MLITSELPRIVKDYDADWHQSLAPNTQLTGFIHTTLDPRLVVYEGEPGSLALPALDFLDHSRLMTVVRDIDADFRHLRTVSDSTVVYHELRVRTGDANDIAGTDVFHIDGPPSDGDEDTLGYTLANKDCTEWLLGRFFLPIAGLDSRGVIRNSLTLLRYQKLGKTRWAADENQLLAYKLDTAHRRRPQREPGQTIGRSFLRDYVTTRCA